MTRDHRAALAQGTDLIGGLVFWTELSGARVNRSLWRASITALGLGDALSEVPRPDKLLGRAAQHATRRGRDGGGVVKLKNKTETEVTYAILMRRDVGARMRQIEEARAVLRRDGSEHAPRVEVDVSAPFDPNRDAIIESLVDGYVTASRYADAEEVSSTLTQCVRDSMLGLTVRPGVYFVPAEHVETAGRLAHTLDELTGATLSVWEQRASERNAGQARREARGSITSQLDELIAEVEQFIAETPLDEIEANSVNVRVKKYKALDAKVDLYADILGDYRNELLSKIDIGKKKLLNAYLGTTIETQ